MRTALVYSACAAVAIAANLVCQALVLWLAGSLWLAMGVGTAVGLVVKFALDRSIVFAPTACKSGRIAGTFILYAGTGVLTTALFWVAELIGHTLIPGDLGRNTGAVVGLLVGYIVKYRLDARFVFRADPA